MEKTVVLAKLTALKDYPIVITSDEGLNAYGGIDGHWLFSTDDGLVEIYTNMGQYSHGIVNQSVSPFIYKFIGYDNIAAIEAYLPHDMAKITTAITGLTPAGTSKTFATVSEEILTNSILKASSPRGYMASDINGGEGYGKFLGSAVSTDKNGISANVRKSAGL